MGWFKDAADWVLKYLPFVAPIIIVGLSFLLAIGLVKFWRFITGKGKEIWNDKIGLVLFVIILIAMVAMYAMAYDHITTLIDKL